MPIAKPKRTIEETRAIIEKIDADRATGMTLTAASVKHGIPIGTVHYMKEQIAKGEKKERVKKPPVLMSLPIPPEEDDKVTIMIGSVGAIERAMKMARGGK